MTIKVNSQISEAILSDDSLLFLRGIAHDYNNISNIIQGNISLAKSHTEPENDGHGRKSYMSLSSGIGGEHFPERYPALIMK